jgi:hypothetical protein
MGVNYNANPATNTSPSLLKGGIDPSNGQAEWRILTNLSIVTNLPQPAPLSTVGGVVTDGVQSDDGNLPALPRSSSQFYIRNAGQPGGSKFDGLADVANSQIAQGGTVTQVASDTSGNSVHFNNPQAPQSPALQAAVDQTNAVPSPVFRNPA